MKARALITLAGGALLLMGGCGGTRHGSGTQLGSASASASASLAPYSLYTHCGIDEVNIDGRWYRADPPLSDGSGNPPKAWANPYQKGLIQTVSATEVEFTDSAGHRVRFVLRPGASGPEHICD
jgi:hypothetical protein